MYKYAGIEFNNREECQELFALALNAGKCFLIKHKKIYQIEYSVGVKEFIAREFITRAIPGGYVGRGRYMFDTPEGVRELLGVKALSELVEGCRV